MSNSLNGAVTLLIFEKLYSQDWLNQLNRMDCKKLTNICKSGTIILRKGDFYVKQPNKKIYKEEQEINSTYWLF